MEPANQKTQRSLRGKQAEAVRNPKSEGQNPKEVPMTEVRSAKHKRGRMFSRPKDSDFGFLSDFGFRPSDLAIPAIWLITALTCSAQPSSAPSPPQPRPQDPLISLMLAQPKIDIESPVVATATF